MKLHRLPSNEFDRLADTTNLLPQARDMARAVLVDGRTQTDVATQYGMSRQRVNLAVSVIQRAYINFSGIVDGDVRVSFEMPEEFALELGALINAIKSCPSDALKNTVLGQAIACIRDATQRLQSEN